MHLQRAAFDGSAALEQLGQVDADRVEAGLAQLLGEAGRGGGITTLQAVGDRVEAEHVGVGAGHLDGVGEELAQPSRATRRLNAGG